MFHIYLREMPGRALDRVYIARVGTAMRFDLAGRKSAIAFLEAKGCCPNAAASLHGADYGPVYEIAEPRDLGGPRSPSPSLTAH